MYYYRIMSERYYREPFSSSGNAGRWNPKGTHIIYASNSPALAQLEYLSIMGNVVATSRWFMIKYKIRDKSQIEFLNVRDLPKNWNALPHGLETQQIGKDWSTQPNARFLAVPSARLELAFFPDQHNILIKADMPPRQKFISVDDIIPFRYLLGTKK